MFLYHFKPPRSLFLLWNIAVLKYMFYKSKRTQKTKQNHNKTNKNEPPQKTNKNTQPIYPKKCPKPHTWKTKPFSRWCHKKAHDHSINWTPKQEKCLSVLSLDVRFSTTLRHTQQLNKSGRKHQTVIHSPYPSPTGASSSCFLSNIWKPWNNL